MSRVTVSEQWAVQNGQTWERRFIRGAARNASISLLNYGPGTANMYIRTFNYVGGLYDGHVLQWQPSFFYPMHGGSLADAGSFAETAVLTAGVLVNTNMLGVVDTDPDYWQVGNGYIRIHTASVFSSYNGPFTVEMWLKPTLITALTPIWYEANAGLTHYMHIYLDTDRRIGFRMSNAGFTFNVKVAAGPQLVLNAWNHIVCNYVAPNFTTYVNNVSDGGISVGAGGLDTFADANATYAGLVGGTANGFMAAPAAYNLTSVTIPGYTGTPAATPQAAIFVSQRWYDMVQTTYTTDLDTASPMAVGYSFNGRYGDGTAKVLPAAFLVGFNPIAGGDALGYLTVMLED